MIEWGCKYRLKHSEVTHRPGDWSYAPAENLEEAREDVRHFEESGKFDAGLIWHTAAVLPGPWQDWVPPQPQDGEEITPQVLSDMLLLVSDTPVPPEVIATWTADEREVAGQWAAAEHLHASDNPVKRMPKPDFVQRAEEICASAAQAQLAIEAWQGRTATDAWMMNPAAVARMAREAITGLIVLLGAGQEARA